MTELPSIQRALQDVMLSINPVGKDSLNKTQGFKFRGIDAVLNEVSPHLAKFGVVPLPEVVGEPRWEAIETSKGKPVTACRLTVRYTFVGPAGDSLSAVVAAEAFDSGDKAGAKAMSVAYRTALIQVFAMATGDPDPDEDTYERGVTRPAPTVAQRTPAENAVADAATRKGLPPAQVLQQFEQRYGLSWKEATEEQKFEHATFIQQENPF